ncbi:MAG: DMT family transporter [Candidatus Heimdallarchaeaceae archaeon]
MDENINFAFIASIVAGFLFGSIPVISAILRDLGISSIEQTLLRLLFGAVFGLLIILYYSCTKNKKCVMKSLSKSIQLTYIVQSVLFVLMIIVYLSSIAVGTPAGEAALLIQIHPFITLFFGWLFLKEKITTKKITALLLATIGLITLTELWNWESFLSSLIGDFFAILNGLLYAFYLLVGRASAKKRKNIPYFLSIAWVLFWSIILGIPIIALFSYIPLPPELISFSLSNITSLKIILIGVGFALCCSVLPYGLLMISAKYLESSKTSLLLLDEPIFAIILGAIILNEPITIWYILGGLGILSGVLIIILDSRGKKESITKA